MKNAEVSYRPGGHIRGIGESPDPEGEGIDQVQLLQFPIGRPRPASAVRQIYCRLCGEHLIVDEIDIEIAERLRPEGVLRIPGGHICDPMAPLPIDCICSRCHDRIGVDWSRRWGRP